MQIDAPFPPKLVSPLFEGNYRYRVFYGGRGGGKSWAIARALLIMGVQRPIRVVCVREFMSSIADSVHKLLADQIMALGLESHYTIEKSTIFGPNGTEFRFAGIRNNPQGLKSMEGCHYAWCEEAASMTRRSWDILIPTIRRPGSEIWISFNPELAADDTYQRFIVNTPPHCITVKVNYLDNPWCPQVLHDEANYMRDNDPDSYNNIWLGFPRVHLDSAVYGKELRAAEAEGRICKVPYDNTVGVQTFWDLGWRDSTSIVCAQVIAGEFRIIDFVQGNFKPVLDYVKELNSKPYLYTMDWLPHDAVAKSLGTGRSIVEIMRGHGRRVQVVPRLRINDGINAARTMFPRTWFDATKCADLLHALRHYRYDLEGDKPEPIHDEHSHAADSFKYAAIALRAPKTARSVTHKPSAIPVGWMA